MHLLLIMILRYIFQMMLVKILFNLEPYQEIIVTYNYRFLQLVKIVYL